MAAVSPQSLQTAESLVQQFKGLPLPLLVAAICLGMTFLTEVTSNTATANIMMPILALVNSVNSNSK